MPKSALYVRVSTSHQIDRDSLPFQRQELTNYSKYVLGIDDYEIFEDAGYSAKNTDRPKYQEMMSRIRKGEFSHLLVWKIDRISRNLKDFTEMYDEMKTCGITFISKNEQFDTSSAMGEAMLKIILVFAELERKITGERVYSIMLSRAEKGLWNGTTVPLGYKWSKEVKYPVIDDNEALTVQYVYNIYDKCASTSQVAFQLNSENIKTKRGGKWTAKTINDILHNVFYIGTYRYNVKTKGTRRLKDEKDWVVVENNHPGIISPEQFSKVNEMLSANYRGDGKFQRANTNVHIFSKILFCGKCGSGFNAGLDRERKDGFHPSRYTCSSSKYIQNINNCNNFVSDVTLLPFIVNYISNFVNLQNRITQKHSLRDIERILLRGSPFIDVIGIDRKGLESTYLAFASGMPNEGFNIENDAPESNFELETLKKEKQKFEKALSRLEDLFLYSEEAMSQKDFLFKKRDIVQNIERINNELSNLYKSMSDTMMATDVSFLSKASNFLISRQIWDKHTADCKDLLAFTDKSIIKEFIQAVISKIVVVDKKIISITFQNGITHNLIYKPKEQQKARTKEKFLYKSFEPLVIEYLTEHGSASRVDIEKLTGMTRTSALSILNEFVERGIIEKKGNSTAIKYFVNQEKTT